MLGRLIVVLFATFAKKVDVICKLALSLAEEPRRHPASKPLAAIPDHCLRHEGG
jgi:hypothetical protein